MRPTQLAATILEMLAFSSGFAAYGWKSDLSDEEILERLRSLNLERGK